MLCFCAGRRRVSWDFTLPNRRRSLKPWWDNELWWLGVLALPLVQIKNLVLYVSTRETLAAKVGTIICFLPVLVLSNAVDLTLTIRRDELHSMLFPIGAPAAEA
jgi:drug/metabolite transporter (DMT)-like permease